MSAINNFMNKKLAAMQGVMFTATLAEIKKVDFEYMRCDIKPLFDDEAKIIVDVPFGFPQNDDFVIRFPYKKGDIVLVVFCKEDIAPILFEDGNRDMAAEEQFREDDAFVIGGVNLFTKPVTEIPREHDESLLLARKDFKTYIEIDKDKNINLVAKEGKITMEAKGFEQRQV